MDIDWFSSEVTGDNSGDNSGDTNGKESHSESGGGGGHEVSAAVERDDVVFIIDSREPMHRSYGDDDKLSPFKMSVRAAMDFCKNKAISCPRDRVGVCLFGSHNTHNQHSIPHLWFVHEMDVVGAEMILDLKRLEDEQHEFNDNPLLPGGEDVGLHDILWVAQSCFRDGRRSDYRRCFLFTNDVEIEKEETLVQKCQSRVRDMLDDGVFIELFALPCDSGVFDMDVFWSKVLPLLDGGVEMSALARTISKLEELRSGMKSKVFPKRVLSTLPLRIAGDAVEMGVQLFLLRRQAPPTTRKMNVDRVDNRPLRSETRYLSSTTGEVLDATRQAYRQYSYGGEPVRLSLADQGKSSGGNDSVGLVLYGFLPESSLKISYQVGHSYFMYPDERSVEGSTVAFVALLDAMEEQKVVGLARACMRRNSPSRFVALVPQKEEKDEESGFQTTPRGVLVVSLPFSEEIRSLSWVPIWEGSGEMDEEGVKAPEAGKRELEIARGVVDDLTVDYHDGDVNNPTLQQHYAVLQAKALDMDEVPVIEDQTLPASVIDTKESVKRFIDDILGGGYVSAPPAKKARKDSGRVTVTGGGKLSHAEMENIAKEGRIEKCTVAVLKDFLKDIGERITGKKAELVSRVLDWFKSNS